MNPPQPPLERFFNLADLSAAGQEVHVTAGAEELARIAAFSGVQSLDRFEARIALRKKSQTHFSYAADLVTDVTQSCVVTLEPVAAHIERSFERELHLVARIPGNVAPQGAYPVADADDDEVEEDIETTRYDLAAPLLEEFLLALDPYPRAPGVTFEPPPSDEARSESPFAVLKALKEKE